ncbi:MAG: aminotransferase class I/II-fold pyridoxal phosphate-dependent enzyme, partial [Brooklawnia sp.]
RGGLEALRLHGLRIEGIPMREGGMDVDLFAQALKRRPAALYCQTGIHNPTGQTMGRAARARLAGLINQHGLPVIEDVCSYELTLDGPPARTLAGLVDPGLIITVGTLSKLFWGGLRVGWARADEARVRALVERRKVIDLAGSVVDQLMAARLLARAGEARAERRQMLRRHLASTEAVIAEVFGHWTWAPVKGGTGLWVDTGTDAQAMSEAAKRVGVKLAAGPSASAHDAQRTMIRLPLWHEPGELRDGLQLVREALSQRR